MDYYFGDGVDEPVRWDDDPDVALGGGPADGVLLDFTGDGARDDVMWDSTGDGVADHVVLEYDSGAPRVFTDPDGSGTWATPVGGGDEFDFSSRGEPAEPSGVADGRELLGSLSGRWAELPAWVSPDVSMLPGGVGAVGGDAPGVGGETDEAGAGGEIPGVGGDAAPVEPDPGQGRSDESADASPGEDEAPADEIAEEPAEVVSPDVLPEEDAVPLVEAPISEPDPVAGPRLFEAPGAELTPEPPVQAGTVPDRAAEGGAGGSVDGEPVAGEPVVGADGSVTVDTDTGPMVVRDADGDGYLDAVDRLPSPAGPGNTDGGNAHGANTGGGEDSAGPDG